MSDLYNLPQVIVQKNLDRVDLDLATVYFEVPIVNVDGEVTGGSLNYEVRVDDPRLTGSQRTTLKNVIVAAGKLVLKLA